MELPFAVAKDVVSSLAQFNATQRRLVDGTGLLMGSSAGGVPGCAGAMKSGGRNRIR